MYQKRSAAPDSTALRVALWRAMHVQVDDQGVRAIVNTISDFGGHTHSYGNTHSRGMANPLQWGLLTWIRAGFQLCERVCCVIPGGPTAELRRSVAKCHANA
jgi:hypothetical protein